nr:hypothetical protein [Methanobacterium formicicum]
MTEISNQETAVLGLLYEHHHYAYRIREIMEKKGEWITGQMWIIPPYPPSLKAWKRRD